jgi:phosphoribosylformylglycinamidine synthase PurS subunit
MAKDARKGKGRPARAEPAGMTFVARVSVSLKPTVNDPEGNTIAGALHSLGFAGVESVRSGKYFQVKFSADSPKAAKKLVDQMCSRLLANPVIEAYSFEVSEAS